MSLSKQIDKLLPEFEIFYGNKFVDITTEIEGRFKVICPVTKKEDELWLHIKFLPNNDGHFIEYVSFYGWLLSLENEELGIEGSCDKIYNAIYTICKPTLLKVKVETGYRVINQKAIRKSWHTHLEKR